MNCLAKACYCFCYSLTAAAAIQPPWRMCLREMTFLDERVISCKKNERIATITSCGERFNKCTASKGLGPSSMTSQQHLHLGIIGADDRALDTGESRGHKRKFSCTESRFHEYQVIGRSTVREIFQKYNCIVIFIVRRDPDGLPFSGTLLSPILLPCRRVTNPR